MKRNMPAAWLLLLLAVTMGCASTRVTSTWKAPGVLAQPYQKIMVVGIIREADRTIREQMEAHLMGDLKTLGYEAVSAYQYYGPKAFQNQTEAEVLQSLRAQGIGALLTIVLLDKKKEKYYVPGRMAYTPYNAYHSRFWGYYNSLSFRIQSPGYYEESTRYFWESNLYDLATGQLLYSVQTQSFDPLSMTTLAHEYGQKILQSLLKGGVLKKVTASVAQQTFSP